MYVKDFVNDNKLKDFDSPVLSPDSGQELRI
jgi:hypothetical protein